MRTPLWVMATLALWLGVAPGARAEEPMHPEARDHLERGLALFQEERYDEAVAEFEEGYAVDPRPELLYAMAQARRLGGDCRSAVELYERFLATGPRPKQREAARANVDRCQEEIALAEAAAVEAAPAAEAAAPVPAAPAPAAAGVDRPAWYRDPLGMGLTTAGVGVMGLGLGLSLSAAARADAAREAPTYGEYQAGLDAARSRRTLGVAGMVVGAGLVTAGVIRFLLLDEPSPSRTVSAWAGPDGAGVQVGGTF